MSRWRRSAETPLRDFRACRRGVCFARILLYEELRKAVPGSAINLFTDLGKAELISNFEWTPLTRMSNKQAREARVQFIRQHSDLAGDFRKLAESLQKAGLYSESTTSWQIVKFLPSLIAEAEKLNS